MLFTPFVLPPGYKAGQQQRSRPATREEQAPLPQARAKQKPRQPSAGSDKSEKPNMQDSFESLLNLIPEGEDKEKALDVAVKAGYRKPKPADAADASWSLFKKAEQEAAKFQRLLHEQKGKFHRLLERAEEAQTKVLEYEAKYTEAEIKQEELRMEAMEKIDASKLKRTLPLAQQKQLRSGLQSLAEELFISEENVDRLEAFLANALASQQVGLSDQGDDEEDDDEPSDMDDDQPFPEQNAVEMS